MRRQRPRGETGCFWFSDINTKRSRSEAQKRRKGKRGSKLEDQESGKTPTQAAGLCHAARRWWHIARCRGGKSAFPDRIGGHRREPRRYSWFRCLSATKPSRCFVFFNCRVLIKYQSAAQSGPWPVHEVLRRCVSTFCESRAGQHISTWDGLVFASPATVPPVKRAAASLRHVVPRT